MRKIMLLAVAAVMFSGCEGESKTEVAPVAEAPAPAAAVPAAAPALEFPSSYLGKPVATFVPSPAKACVGRVDTAVRTPEGIAAGGWAWDLDLKSAFGKFLVVDSTGVVIGAGNGGASRPDVQAVIAEATDPNVGWNATGSATDGSVEVYGLTADGAAACSIGKADLPPKS